MHPAPCTAGGYDSDVEWEKAVDYVSKTYAEPLRDATVGAGKPRPHEQEQEGDGDSQRAKVSRTSAVAARVVTTEGKKRVNVS